MAAFSGQLSDEWSGPKNPLGQAQFHIYQYNRPVGSLKEAFATGEFFQVVWYYDPSNEEIDAGSSERGRATLVFGPKDTYLSILGRMYALRRKKLATRDFSNTPEGLDTDLSDFH